MEIARDNRRHFVACLAVAAIIALIVASVGARPLPSCVAGFLGATACGAGKEYGDSRAAGNAWSWWDMIADGAGAVVGCMAGFAGFLN